MSGQATDAFVVELHALWKRLLDNYDIDVPQLLILAGQLRDSLPPCPTCDEIRAIDPDYADDHCPDCVDGKVSIGRLVAVYERLRDNIPTLFEAINDRLRAIR